jgi:hypothetical protein
MAIVNGTNGNDVLEGTSKNDSIFGLAGDDSIEGGPGADHLDGGEGIDRAMYRDSPVGVTVNLETGTGFGGTAQGDTLVDVEDIEGSHYGDTPRAMGATTGWRVGAATIFSRAAAEPTPCTATKAPTRSRAAAAPTGSSAETVSTPRRITTLRPA